MLIALIAHDKPGALNLRKENREAHLAYLKSTDVVQQAGPLLNDDGEMAGSLLVLDVENMTEAKNWAENDPYAQAGLFADVKLIVWNRVIG